MKKKHSHPVPPKPAVPDPVRSSFIPPPPPPPPLPVVRPPQPIIIKPQAPPPQRPRAEDDIHTQLMRKILERRAAMNEQEEPKVIKTQESDEWSQ
jgi:hypothetical protein